MATSNTEELIKQEKVAEKKLAKEAKKAEKKASVAVKAPVESKTEKPKTAAKKE